MARTTNDTPELRTVTARLTKVDQTNGAGYFTREDMKLKVWMPRSHFSGTEGTDNKLALTAYHGQAISIGEVAGSTLKLATIEERQRYAHPSEEVLQGEIEILQAKLAAMRKQ